MWSIFKNGKLIANNILNKYDTIDMRLCLYRGPNRVIWHCHENYQYFNGVGPATSWVFEIKHNGVIYIKYNMHMTSCFWDHKTGTMEVTLVPDLQYYLRDYSNKYVEANSIDHIINIMINPSFNVSIAKDLKDVEIFNSLSIKGRKIDVLCELADEIGGVEVFASDTNLVFGRAEVSIEGIPIVYHKQQVNNHSINYVYGKEFITYNTSDQPVIPGTLVSINGNGRRVIYTRYIFGPDSHYSGDVGTSNTTLITTDDTDALMENHLLSVLPEDDRLYLETQYRISNLHAVEIGHIDRGGVVTPDYSTQRHVVNTNIHTHDMDNIRILPPIPKPTIQSSPFAGVNAADEMVGIMYPKVDRQIDVMVKRHNFDDSAITVGNLWNLNGNTPFKFETFHDYRFHLGGGYGDHVSPFINEDYDPENEDSEFIPYNKYTKYIRGKMDIGVWSDPSGSELPEIDVGGLSIDMDEKSYELSSVRLWSKELEDTESDDKNYINEMYLDFNYAFSNDELETNLVSLVNEKGDIQVSATDDDTIDHLLSMDVINKKYLLKATDGTAIHYLEFDLDSDAVTLYNENGNINITTGADLKYTIGGLYQYDVEGNFDLDAADITIDSSSDKINIQSGTKGAARNGDGTISNTSADVAFWTFFKGFYQLITGPPIPEAGMGAPSSFQQALSAVVNALQIPDEMKGKINEGSSKVKIG